jgi:transcriptional regulator with XRE-family HTH domain
MAHQEINASVAGSSAADQPLTIAQYVGTKIRQARIDRKLSQAALAHHAGLPAHRLLRIERGRLSVGATELLDIAMCLGHPISFFYSEKLAEPSLGLCPRCRASL